jgi:hypothetical protein
VGGGQLLKTYVEFRSDSFPPAPDELEQVNPGRWGRKLAHFLSVGLRQQGYNTKEPVAEDWGWLVPVESRSVQIWIGCGNYEEHADGFLCFIEPRGSALRRFFRRGNVNQEIEVLRKSMDELLSSHFDIREKHWWTREEFETQNKSL